MFLTLHAPEAILGDSNDELMNCYQVVRDDVETLIALLSRHARDRECYYRVRQQDPMLMDQAARAARFIYLNKTCFNGIYRVNLKGQFNVPYGNRKARVYDEENLRHVSLLLKGVTLLRASYETTLQQAGPGDFIYLDPPYYPSSKTANFAKYTSPPFGKDDQIGLASELKRLTRLGCRVMLSNSDTEFIRGLYGEYRQETVAARRLLNCNGNRRRGFTEVLVMNYEPRCPSLKGLP